MSCKPLSAIVDCRIVCEPPHYVTQYNRYQHGTNEYWEYFKKQVNDWAKEFNDFIRDHRSQDSVNIFPELIHELQCSNCFSRWETFHEEGQEYCASCGVIVNDTK